MMMFDDDDFVFFCSQRQEEFTDPRGRHGGCSVALRGWPPTDSFSPLLAIPGRFLAHSWVLFVETMMTDLMTMPNLQNNSKGSERGAGASPAWSINHLMGARVLHRLPPEYRPPRE